MKLTGIFLPIVTPFKDGKIDYTSYQRLINYYSGQGISGIIPLGTTGEICTLNDYEFEEMIAKTMEYNHRSLPIYIGVGGNDTHRVKKKAKTAEKYKVQGMLSVCPYYNRPNQEGIYQHFKSIAQNTSLDIIIYNIPYRTGVNIENETIHRLAQIDNIIGLKDCSGDMKQSTNLLMSPPEDFSILTGEDFYFYQTLVLGGNGGILASAHLKTELFVQVYKHIQNNDYLSALNLWHQLHDMIPSLFREPNPAPIKYLLKEQGLIDSDEVRLPITPVSNALKEKLRPFIQSPIAEEQTES